MFFNKPLHPVRVPHALVLILGLSWLYAVCSQLTLWLPCMPVPVSLQPLPLYLATFMFGWPAVSAYVLYLVQGALGLPFFAAMQGGFMRLLGPTGGYLIGFLCAMMFIAIVREHVKKRWYCLLAAVYVANILSFGVGLWRLSSFVAASELLATGLYPFLLGDIVLKPLVLVSIMGMWLRRK